MRTEKQILNIFLNDLVVCFFLVIIGLCIFFILLRTANLQLYFVDAGRYSDVSRNVLNFNRYTTDFAFFPKNAPNKIGWNVNLPPMHIYFISLFFYLLGTKDLSVILESGLFYILTAPLIYLLGKEIFSKRVGLFSALIFLFSPQILDYAKDGASEPLFIAELVLFVYLIVKNKNWSFCLAGIVLGAIMFTKLQSEVLFIPFILWAFIQTDRPLNRVYFSFGVLVIFILYKFGLLFGFYKFSIPTYLAFQQTNKFPGDSLERSHDISSFNLLFLIDHLKDFLVKIIYNIYNFYKEIFISPGTLPKRASPLISIGYTFSNIYLLIKEKSKTRVFRIAIGFIFILLLLSSATSPENRYILPVLPFMIILTVDLIFLIINHLEISPVIQNYLLLVLVLLYFILPFIGSSFIDTRFTSRIYNLREPYAQSLLGLKIGKITPSSSITVTNLDTWGSWYGDRKTVLIPQNFQTFQLLNKKIKINYIFLTDYQKDNQDHPLSGDWGLLFDHPGKIKNQFILEKFKLVKVATISANLDYENKPFTYKLWERK